MNLTKETWTKKDYNNFLEYLFTFKEEKYKNFQEKIINTKKIIGVRTNILKKIAKEITKGNYQEFLKQIENNYYEENLLYGLIITNIKEVNIVINTLNKYISIIDNWASCDLTISNLKIVKNNKQIFYNFILKNINNPYPYTQRFCYVLLLNYYLEKEYLNTIFKLCNIPSDNYYVNMSKAWLLSTCYINYKEETIKYLKNNKLDSFTYNKTIQKIKESNKLTTGEKDKLKKYVTIQT